MYCPTMSVKSLWEAYPTVWFHYLAHRQIQHLIMSSSDDHACFWNFLILILYHWPDCHKWCCLLTTNGAIILCVPILDYCTISIKSPSCLFCRLMRLVIALMRISYGTRLNRQINAYVWFKSIFHLLKYQLWCYVLCEGHLKMLNVKLCQAMLPSFYPQMIVHCHLTGDHMWESTMSTKLYGWACVIPQCIRVISKKHLWLYAKFMSGYFPLLLYLPYDACMQYICLHDLD